MNWPLLWQGFLETCMMTVSASVISYMIGLPLGVLLVITRKDGIRPAPTFNTVLGAIINFLRSIPFILLIAMLIPVTRVVMGTTIGTTAAVFPLVISASPYVARVVESSLLEVDHGVIEASQSMGSSTWQIITKVLIPEAVPSLINGAAVAVTTILAYTAMVSAVGGGGVGAYAITKGYQRGKKYYDFMYCASAVLVLMVQIITITGTRLTRRLDHRIR
ncbi:MAG: ABC transporter permease [Clostridiales bacterium]|nr:ABC transporter permease [Clostridiales bacterium]